MNHVANGHQWFVVHDRGKSRVAFFPKWRQIANLFALVQEVPGTGLIECDAAWPACIHMHADRQIDKDIATNHVVSSSTQQDTAAGTPVNDVAHHSVTTVAVVQVDCGGPGPIVTCHIVNVVPTDDVSAARPVAPV